MHTNQIVAPRFPTHQEIQRGMAQGRRERSRAVSAMARSLVGFVLCRKVNHIGRTGRIAPLAG